MQKRHNMNILITSSEAVPFAKTGGLADVIGTLVNELKAIGIGSTLILPLYRHIKQSANYLDIKPLDKVISVPLGGRTVKGRLWSGKTLGGADVYFIENDNFYDRQELYGTSEGDYPDNASRFIFYSRGVLETILQLGLKVDVIHCNDWQSGLIPVYLKTIYQKKLAATATVLTVHNLGYQGIFEQSEFPLTGLSNPDGLKFYGKINMLKAGILFADAISTVSGNYAREILTREQGSGLDSVLRLRSDDLYGIINGIDYTDWNPADDAYIQANYTVEDLSGKTKCKEALQRLIGLPKSGSMLIGMVTRLSSQKGLELVGKAMKEIVRSDIQVVILGKGDESLQQGFLKLHKRYRDHLSITTRFDNELAHKIYAGSDIFLMPSRYEPCGLGQLIALRYGSVPVVRKTGGLTDTIREYDPANGTGTGFLFNKYSSGELVKKVKFAHKIFHDTALWRKIRKNAMSQNFSWRKSAEAYISLYQKTLKKKEQKDAGTYR
ncbi:MAG TPA: glycogen synthase GlgA, partial [Nitrospirae bacterium]|nr:glycogen synthase GlgA [Nitrospirota bacterium]